MSRRYGIVYKGSKNALAEWIVAKLPSGTAFVDLFAGGCAITHRALIEGRWSRYICNDIGDVPSLFMDAVRGKYADERRWISREDFEREKAHDPYVRVLWSFGANCESYLYGELGVEQVAAAMHAIVFAETIDGRMAGLRQLYKALRWVDDEAARVSGRALEMCADNGITPILRIDGTPDAAAMYTLFRTKLSGEIRQYLCDALKASGLTQKDVERHLGTFMARHYFSASQWELPTAEAYAKMREIMPALTTDWAELNEEWQSLQRLQSLQSLQRLQSLQSLQQCPNIGNMTILRGDYRDVNIPDGAVVYADPPYRGTSGYGVDFDFDAFDEWLRTRPFPVFVSEYSMPDDFAIVAERPHRSKMSATENKVVTERLYVHERFAQSVSGVAPFTQLTLFNK